MQDHEIRDLFLRSTQIIVGAIFAAARGEEEFMADALDQALADLTTAVASATAEISAELATITANAGGSAEITAAASNIEGLVGQLNTAVSSAQTPPVDTPPAQ